MIYGHGVFQWSFNDDDDEEEEEEEEHFMNWTHRIVMGNVFDSSSSFSRPRHTHRHKQEEIVQHVY